MYHMHHFANLDAKQKETLKMRILNIKTIFHYSANNIEEIHTRTVLSSL